MSLREGNAADTTCGFETTLLFAGEDASDVLNESAWFATDVASGSPVAYAKWTAISAEDTWSSGPDAASEASAATALCWADCPRAGALATKNTTAPSIARLAVNRLNLINRLRERMAK